MATMRGSMALLALLALSGCRGPLDETGEAVAVVRAFYGSLHSAGCDVLGPMLALGPDTTCEMVVGEMRSHGLALLEVEKALPDGRNPDAVIVRARLAQHDQVMEGSKLLRVEKIGGRWRLRP